MTPTIPALDVNFVRQQFPSNRWQLPFFENAGGAFVPNAVISHMLDYMTNAQVQTGYPSQVSNQATSRVNAGLGKMAEFIGAESDEVTLGPSTSMNVYVLAQALRPLWQAGDEIIVSTLNHESNSGPWRRLEEFGLKIIDWPVDKETGRLDSNELKPLLTSNTALVAFPHVSNITGDINDVAAITKLCHQFGALACVDGVAFAPHRTVDVKKWDVDIYLFSFYKVFGPHLGLMYTKRDLLSASKGQYHYFFPQDDLPHKLNPAGPNHETIASLSGIADYFDALYKHHFGSDDASFFDRVQRVFQLIALHEQSLASKFLGFVSTKPKIRLLGINSSRAAARVPTFSLQIAGFKPQEICAELARRGVACGSGHFYAKRLLESMHLEDKEVLRCSMSHYNSIEDVDQLIQGLSAIID
ncbi:MAG: cysteine desulfurase family protein (TIGR01976 family) [Pseudohongiellaceae bacterium]|jgi:cysteine desulfurase family protein (TIGR01976 family)